MSLEIYGLDLRLAKKMLFTGVNLRIDKPNLVVYVIDEAGLFIEGADVNILSAGHNLNSVSDALGTALTRVMPAINNTLTVSKDGYATSTQIIYNETPSTLSVYVQLYASEIRLKVVNNQNEPIEGATCRVLNAIGGRNNVLSFDGVDDYVNMGYVLPMGLNDRTHEFWFKVRSVGTGHQTILGKSRLAAGVGRYFYVFNNTQFRGILEANGNKDLNVGWSLLNVDEWNHCATVYDRDGSMSIYLNGELAGTMSISNGSALDLQNNDLFGLGAYPNQGSTAFTTYWFNGWLSEVRVWNKVRSQIDIQADMFKRLTGGESDLLAYWPLSEGEGSVANDNASTIDGIIHGAQWQEADESFPLFDGSIQGYEENPYDSQTTNANGLCTLQYQINTIHGLEVTLPGKRRFIMPFQRTTRGLLDWQVMLSDYLATFATDRGNILINSEPENNDATFLIE